MNIGIVTSWYERGAAYVSLAYMNALEKQGHEVKIYARGGGYYARGDPNWDLPDVTWGMKYKPLPLGRNPRFTNQYVNMLHFEGWLRKNDIEILIFNEERIFRTVDRARKLGYISGAYVDYYKKNTVQQFETYDFLLCNTRRHYSVFRDFPNSLFIPWGTDVDLFQPKARECGESTASQVVFFHSAGWGGANIRKGTDLLLKAFQQVTGNVRLVIHSQAPLSKFGDAAADIVRRDARIEFIERTVPAPGLYHLGDVFVYPSRLEGIGLCVPEALACGLPVITTDDAPMNEFVKDGVNGLLVRVKEKRTRKDSYYWPESIVDIGDLTRAMQVYIDDKGLLALHKKQARKSAETRLDWMKNAAELSHHLQGFIRGADRRRRQLRFFGERLVWWAEAKYVAFLTYARRAAKKVLRRV